MDFNSFHKSTQLAWIIHKLYHEEHEVHEEQSFNQTILLQLNLWSIVQPNCSTYCFAILRVLRVLRGKFIRLDLLRHWHRDGLRRHRRIIRIADPLTDVGDLNLLARRHG